MSLILSIGMLFVGAASAGDASIEQAVWQKLVLRDSFAGCQAVFALGAEDQVRDALLVATAAERPSWAPMRAAECIAERAGTDSVAREAVRGWMKDPSVPGLALVALGELGTLEEPLAVELANLAVERAQTDARFARYARPRLAECSHAAVRELAVRVPE